MGELILAGNSEFERYSESLNRHDGNGPNCRADGEIDKRILLAVYRTYFVYHYSGKYYH